MNAVKQASSYGIWNREGKQGVFGKKMGLCPRAKTLNINTYAKRGVLPMGKEGASKATSQIGTEIEILNLLINTK